MSGRRSRRQIWTIPALLAVLTTAALVVGLLGDGVFDLLASLGLAVPVAVSVWALWTPARRPASRDPMEVLREE